MKVIIDGTSYDTPAGITYLERQIIRDVTHRDGIEWLSALQTLDDDVALGYAAVALHRVGKYRGAEAFLNMKVGSIILDLDEEIALLEKARAEEAGGRPPAEAADEAAAPKPKSRPSSRRSASSRTRKGSGTPS